MKLTACTGNIGGPKIRPAQINLARTNPYLSCLKGILNKPRSKTTVKLNSSKRTSRGEYHPIQYTRLKGNHAIAQASKSPLYR